MSYRDALKGFRENVAHINPPLSDAQNYNLNRALELLTLAIQADFRNVDDRLQKIERLIRDLPQR